MPSASPPKSPKPIVVFDLDGTLVDSAPDLIDTLNVILACEGYPALPLEEGRRMVGAGGRVLIRRGIEANGASVSDARLEELFAAYLASYDDHLADRTRFYPGAEAGLDKLAAAGFTLAVLTNKYEAPAIKLLRALGAADRFATICGQNTFPVCKPHAAALTLTIEKAGGDAKRAIMVGDTITDVTTAKNAGIPVIAVNFGYADRPVASMDPDRIIGHFSELEGAVAELAAAFSAAV
jgi:phosphoglycolate phosphatase